MKTAIERGLAFSPDVQKAQALVNQTDAMYRVAQSALFPTLSAQGLTRTNRNSVTYSPFNGNSQINGLYNDTYTAQLVASQPLYKGGAISAGLSAGKVSQDMARQSLFKVKQDYLSNLLAAYYNASEFDQKLQMAKLNRDVLKGYLTVTEKYVNIGRNRTMDRLQAQANYQLAEAEILRLETLEEQSIQDLLKLTGDTELAHARLETHFDAQPVQTGTLDQAFSRASENNPDIRMRRLQVELREYQNDLTTASDWPSLSLDGTAGYVSPDQQHMWDTSSQFYSVGLTLTVPLFTGLSSFAQRRANRELVHQDEKDLTTEMLTIKENLAVAMATVQRNFEQVKLNRSAADVARKAMDSAMAEYRRGLVTSSDVILVQSTRYQAETQFLTAQFSYLRQILNLRHDLGVDLEKIYAGK